MFCSHRHLPDEATTEDVIADIRLYLQQQRAWASDHFRAMVDAKTRGFADTRPAHRPCKLTSSDKRTQ